MNWSNFADSQLKSIAAIADPGPYGALSIEGYSTVTVVYVKDFQFKRVADIISAAQIAVLGQGSVPGFSALVLDWSDLDSMKAIIQE